jgi:polysaccharide biosynthesis protein PslG
MHFEALSKSIIPKTASTLVLAIFISIPKISAQSINQPSIIPDGLGLNIHFTKPQPGEMDQLAKTGSRIIRTDLLWHSTERDSGEYDFSNYDRPEKHSPSIHPGLHQPLI